MSHIRSDLQGLYLALMHRFGSVVPADSLHMRPNMIHTFPENGLQKFPKPRGDASDSVTGVPSVRQQEGQLEIEALL